MHLERGTRGRAGEWWRRHASSRTERPPPRESSARRCADHQEVAIRITKLHERHRPDVNHIADLTSTEIVEMGAHGFEIIRPPEETRRAIGGEVRAIRVEREPHRTVRRELADRALVRGSTGLDAEKSPIPVRGSADVADRNEDLIDAGGDGRRRYDHDGIVILSSPRASSSANGTGLPPQDAFSYSAPPVV
jgi:hypothetical protein